AAPCSAPSRSPSRREAPRPARCCSTAGRRRGGRSPVDPRPASVKPPDGGSTRRRLLRPRGRVAQDRRQRRKRSLEHPLISLALTAPAKRRVLVKVKNDYGSAQPSSEDPGPDDTGLVREDDGWHAVTEIELSQDVPDVRPDRRLAEQELTRDLRVRARDAKLARAGRPRSRDRPVECARLRQG